jgi:hypothetical protein
MLLLLLALVSGGLAAYATMRLLQERTSALPAYQHVIAIAGDPKGYDVIIGFSGKLRVDTTGVPANARNMALLYEGKTVAVTDDDRSCVTITPLLQVDPPELALDRYQELISLGFSNTDLAVSYALPAQTIHTTPDPSVYSAADRYSVPSVCARRL